MNKKQRTIEEQGMRNRAASSLRAMHTYRSMREENLFYFSKGYYSALCVELDRPGRRVSY